MDIDDLTVRQLREIQTMGAGSSAPESAFKVGDKYLIRCVTYHMLGKLVRVTAGELVLDAASWVAVSGRLVKALASGQLEETEYLGDGVIVLRGAAVDAMPWTHALPTETK